MSIVLLNRVGRWAPIYLGLFSSKLFNSFFFSQEERGKIIVFHFLFGQGSYFVITFIKTVLLVILTFVLS